MHKMHKYDLESEIMLFVTSILFQDLQKILREKSVGPAYMYIKMLAMPTKCHFLIQVQNRFII